MSEKRRLGKGLGALIPDVITTSGDINEIPLAKIKPNPYQPRKDFDPDKLQQLAESIREHGVLQAVVVSPEDDGYILIAGERRCRAAKMAGLKSVPGIVRAFDHEVMLELALVENLQRDNLNPVEEARAYRKLVDDFQYTQEDLAQRVGKSRSAVANSLRLLSLPENILESLASGKISPGQARPLIVMTDPEAQKQVMKKIVSSEMSAREVEKEVAKISAASNGKSSASDEKNTDPLIAELQVQLQRIYGTKVTINAGASGGKIEIYYYGDDDLDRLIAKLLPDGL